MKEPFLPQAVIARKRDGEILEKADIEQFITALIQDRLSDAQVGAFAMAVFLKSMTTDECAAPQSQTMSHSASTRSITR